MAPHIYGSFNKYSGIGIDLNQAGVIAFIPIISTPGLILYIFYSECFSFRQTIIGFSAFSCFGYGSFKNGIQFIFRNDEAVSKILESILNSPLAWQ